MVTCIYFQIGMFHPIGYNLLGPLSHTGHIIPHSYERVIPEGLLPLSSLLNHIIFPDLAYIH